MRYENLRKVVRAEYEHRASVNADRILAVTTRGGATKESVNAANRWATKGMRAKYESGETCLDCYLARAEKRMRVTLEKDMRAALAKIDTIEAAEKPESFVLWVDWKKSRTWGMNPYTELIVGGDTYRGKAIGCGALPYYERGIGVSSLVAVLEKCGYNVKRHYSPERSLFEIEKRRG